MSFRDRFKRKNKKYTKRGIEILSFGDFKKDMTRLLAEASKPLPQVEFWDKSKSMPQPTLTERIKQVVIKPPEPEKPTPPATSTPIEEPKPNPEGLLRSIIRRLSG